MNTRQKILIPILLATACAAGVLLGGKLDFSSSDTLFSSNPKKQKLNRLIDYIDYEYVDDVNTDSIVDLTGGRGASDFDLGRVLALLFDPLHGSRVWKLDRFQIYLKTGHIV